MSESMHDSPSPEELIVTAKSAIFSVLGAKLEKGAYYPEKPDTAAEYVAVVPELGRFATATTNADAIQNPYLIHLFRYKDTSRRAIEYWLTPSGIEVQHSAYDENHDPFTINERHQINPEELVELYSELFPSD